MKPFATEDSYPLPARLRAAAGYHREVLTFTLGAEEHGIDILRLREIIRPRPVTEVPRAPAFILGIISVRGEIIPVLDLRRRMRKAARPLSAGKDARVLIVKKGDETYGLLVDSVQQVVRLRDEDVEPPPAPFSGAEGELIAGIARPRPERLIILLDLDAVVSFTVGGRP